MLKTVLVYISIVQNYSSCACIGNVTHQPQQQQQQRAGGSGGDTQAGHMTSGVNGGSDVLPAAMAGLCLEACDTLLPFMVMLFVMTFFISGTQMPLLMITMRWVRVCVHRCECAHVCITVWKWVYSCGCMWVCVHVGECLCVCL